MGRWGYEPFPIPSNYTANVFTDGTFTWQCTIHYMGRDFSSPEFQNHNDMRQWASDFYERNRR
ncbi:hypothetical protein KR52_09395 [Synechococcus sp. KORDI-52]|uniref:hypothetical protein n=1 Tax=Synechococcus sp. KORDI-52 TaxID=585425 RepID=UPI0004E04FE1|nr:hypothetical protein [Synechococcus sp. KORDI-52]AII49355.1 hypothetical protein KR52_09395 [Synechococcus sp. KORDI-52]